MDKKLCLLSLSSLLFSASYNILLPELPNYLITIGGADYLGLIILLFTIAALISRPFNGIISDRKGGKAAIFIGIFFSLFINLLYPVFSNITGFLVLRFIHGFSTGFAPTGYTFFSKNNFENQGRAISIQTAFYSAGMALGPLLSSYIVQTLGLDYLFYSAALLATLSFLLVLPLREIVPLAKTGNNTSLSMFDFQVWRPSICMFWIYLSFGILLIGSPIISTKIGFENKGIFFFYFTISTILCRLILRNKFDLSHFRHLFLTGTFLLVISSFLFSFGETKLGFILASLLYGFSLGIFVPLLNLWTLNKNSGKDGKAISTLYIFMELGIGIGALIVGNFITKDETTFSIIYLIYGISSLGLMAFIEKQK